MDQPTRARLVAELTQFFTAGHAHTTFGQAVAGLPAPLRNQPVPGVPYTIWHLERFPSRCTCRSAGC